MIGLNGKWLAVSLLRAIKWLLVCFALAVILFCAVHPIGFLHVIGVLPRTPSTAYNFWSGFGSDIGEYTIAVSLMANLAGWYRKNNCREDGCWWLGHYDYIDAEGQHHPACKRHHPNMGHGHVFRFHLLHQEKLARQVEDG